MTEQRYPTQAAAPLPAVARSATVPMKRVPEGPHGRRRGSEAGREQTSVAEERLEDDADVAVRQAGADARIGLLYGSPSEAFLNAFLAGAMDVCGLSGAQLIVEKCGDQRGWRSTIDDLIVSGVDGILLTPPLCDSSPVLELLAERNIAAVAVATACPSASVSAVRIDDYEGALSMMRHLISLGHRQIGFIKGDPDHTPAQLRYRAYLDAMSEARLPVAPAWIAEGMFTYRSGLLAARALLEQEDRPTAIFACNDDMAAAVVAAAHGLQLEMPRELAVCGFDDTPLASAIWPKLTTVHQPIEEMGRVAVELVCQQILRRRARQKGVVEHRLLPCVLVPRLSSTPGWQAGAEV